MIGMEKLQPCEHRYPEPVQLYVLENVRDDLEDNPLLLVGQFFLTFVRDLLVDTFLPTEDFDHADDIHNLCHDLNTCVRLWEKGRNEKELHKADGALTHNLHLFPLNALHFGSDPPWKGVEDNHHRHANNGTPSEHLVQEHNAQNHLKGQ